MSRAGSGARGGAGGGPGPAAAPPGAAAVRGNRRLTVLSGPSGVGKGSVVAAVRRRHPDVWLSVSVTTRAPRPGERDGVEYLFTDPAGFAAMVDRDELLEHASYAGHCYGTPRAPVLAALAAGQPALLEIDLQGARQVRARMPDAQLVFLAPPNAAELRRRLAGRGTEDAETVARRLAIAEQELAAGSEFDVVVVNDDVQSAADRLVALMLDSGPSGAEVHADPPR